MRTFRTMGVISTAAALLLSAGVVFAEEGTAVGTTVESPAPTANIETEKAARERVKAEVAAKKAEIEKTAREAKERAKAVAESTSAARKAIATTTRAEIKEIKQTTKERVEGIREEAKARVKVLDAPSTAERTQVVREQAKERVKQEREKVAERMKDVQDKKRQEMLQKLTAQFENLNKTWTDESAKKLDRLNAILQKMESRAATAAANGKDVTAANTAIQIAKNVVATTQASVTAQAAKTYVPDASTLTTTAEVATSQGQEELKKALRASFKTLHETLFKDLFALRDGPMTIARRAVQDALTALSAVPGVNEKSTTSATPAQ